MGDEKSVPQALRLQVYLARCGIGSRRKCEEYIAEGRVAVNGKTVTGQGTKVSPEDTVSFDGSEVRREEVHRYIALHKPPGYLCSNYDPQDRPLAVDLLSPHFDERLFSVGRLDFMSEGLIFYTNDGTFANRAGHPSSDIEKEYLVITAGRLRAEQAESAMKRAVKGVEIDGVLYTVRSYRIDGTHTLAVTLSEGKNREVRRLCDFFDIAIRRLIRVRIGPVRLEGIPGGGFRSLSSREVDWFMRRRHHTTEGHT